MPNDLLLALAALVPPAWTSAATLLLGAALKGALVFAVAAFAARLLERRSATARHAVWTAALGAHLLFVAAAVALPSWTIPMLPVPAWLTPASDPISAPSRAAVPPNGRATSPAGDSPAERPAATPAPERRGGGQEGNTPVVETVTSPASRPSPWTAARVLGAFWIAGALLVLLRLAVGTAQVARLARRGERVDDGRWLSLTQRLANRLGIRRPLTLLRGDGLGIPVTWGVVYPVVLLPADADAWPEERRQFVLVHEMAHVKRFDALTQLVAQLTVALFWFDPLVWVAERRMRAEREHACDDYVLRTGTRPSAYASELLEMVQALGTPRHDAAAPAFAALAMARRSEFEGRMLAILDPHLDRHTLTRRGLTVATGLGLVLALPLAALSPFGGPSTPSVEVAARAAPPVPERSAPAPTPVAATRTIAENACDTAVVGSRTSTSTHIHVDDDGPLDARVLEYLVTLPGRCAQAMVAGDVRFTPDERDVASLGAGAVAVFRERSAAHDRAVRLTAAADGAVERVALLGGRPAPFDDGARAWLADIVPEVLRETGVDAPARVARLRARGGVRAVLAQIAEIRSPYARRKHYEALLDSRGLAPADVERIARSAGRDLAGYSDDLAAVLERLPRRARGAATAGASTAGAASVAAVRAALEDSAWRLRSSGDRTATLATLVPTADRATLLVIAKAARDIPSSGDKAGFLRTTAAHYLTPNDPALRAAYFAAAATVPSGGDLREVLENALPYGHAARGVTAAVIETITASATVSSGDRAAVLIALASQRLLTTPALRDAFVAAAQTVASSTDYRRVMESMLTPR